MRPLPVCLADRYEGVRIVLRERLEAAGAVRVVAAAGSVAAVRSALAALPEDVVLVTGLRFADGTAADLLTGPRRVIVFSWLPPDERAVELTTATAVVGLPLVAGIIGALRGLTVPYPIRDAAPSAPSDRLTRGVPPVPAFHLSLPVSDVEAAADFYVDVLGCGRRRTGSDWADLDFHGHQLSLHHVAGYTPEVHRSEVDGTHVPTRHLGVVLEPFAWRELADRIAAAGVPFLLTPRSRFEGQPGEQHTFFLTDPSGNAVEVKAFPDGVWR